MSDNFKGTVAVIVFAVFVLHCTSGIVRNVQDGFPIVTSGMVNAGATPAGWTSEKSVAAKARQNQRLAKESWLEWIFFD